MIEQFVRRIVEGAVQPSRALAEGLALCFSESLNYIALYKPSAIADYSEGTLKRDHDGVIFAYLAYKDRSIDGHHVKEVIASAATHGYGPIVYDTLLHSGWSIPDQSSVSKSALRVWEYYSKSRPETVIKKLPDMPKDDSSDVSALMMGDERKQRLVGSMYSLPQINESYDQLLAAHDKFVQSFRRYMIPIVIERRIDNLGDNFFSEKYSG
jgi:hypothetical protein